MTHSDPHRIRFLPLGGVAAVLLCLSGCQHTASLRGRMTSWWHQHDGLSVPETLPLGSTVRAHYHTMQTNAEAADFILHRHDFVGSTAELTPAGRDRVMEIAARSRSAPFPIVIERSRNNSNPELDAHRRHIVALIMHDFGIPEADQRVVVAPAYGPGLTSWESELDYYQFIFNGRTNGFGNGFNAGGFGNFGFAGGFGFGTAGFGAGGIR